MTDTLQSVQRGVRSLAAAPAFTIPAIVSIALAIAANAVIFGVANTALMQPLVARDPGSLVRIGGTLGGEGHLNLTVLQFEQLRDSLASVEDIAAHRFNQVPLTGDQGPFEVGVEIVSANFFDVVGVTPLRGRMFGERDAGATDEDVAVISERLWRTAFGADPQIVGRTINASGLPVTVVGIAPARFRGAFAGFDVGIWLPLTIHDRVLPNRGSILDPQARIVNVIGRLATGASLTALNAELATVAGRLRVEPPIEGQRQEGLGAIAATGTHPMIANIATGLLGLLLGIVALLLLIACGNVASLMLARGIAQRRDVAVRRALGAGTARVAASVFGESLLIALAGCALGLTATVWLNGLLSRVALPAGVPLAVNLRADVRVVGFALLLSVFAGLVFGLAPALHASRQDVVRGLRNAGATRATSRLRAVLVIAQLTAATVLLTGAGLLVRSLAARGDIDPGFRVDGIVVALADPSAIGQGRDEARATWEQISATARRLPGTTATAVAQFVPMAGRSDSLRVVVGGDAGTLRSVPYNAIGPGYLELLEIAPIVGRAITDTDLPGSPDVAVVNRTLAETYWPDRSAVGQTLRVEEEGGQPRLLEVIGVVENATYRRPGEGAMPFLYIAEAQWNRSDLAVHFHTTAPPADALRALQEEISAQEPDLAVRYATLRDEVSYSAAVGRVVAGILGAVGLVGLVLAATGLFGTVAYTTASRHHEVAVRIAVGATRASVIRLVIRQGLRAALLGGALGIPLALAASRLLGSLLYGVANTDPVTYVSIGLVLVAVGVAASWLPARRAASVDPAGALRRV